MSALPPSIRSLKALAMPLGACALIFAVLLRDVLKVGNISIYHLVSPVVFGALLLRRLWKRSLPTKIVIQDAVFLLILVWLTISPLWAGVATDYWLFMGWLLFGFITWYASREFFLAIRDRYLRIVSITFIGMLSLSMLESLTPFNLPTSRIRALELSHLGNVPTATFWNQNDLAFYLVLFIGCAVAGTQSKLGILILFSATAYVLFAISSTAAWIGFFTFILAYFLIRRKQILLLASLAAIVLPIAIVTRVNIDYAIFHLQRIMAFAERGASVGAGSSIDVRLRLISHGWNGFIKSNGLGLGPGGVRDALHAAGSDIVTLHNLPLEILFNGGILIFVIVVAAYLIALRRLYRLSTRATPQATNTLHILMWATLVGLPFAALGPAFTPYISSFWIWLGILSGLVLDRNDRTLNDANPNTLNMLTARSPHRPSTIA